MTIQKRTLVLTGVVLLTLILSSVISASELDLSFDKVEYSQIYQMLGDSQGLNVLVDPSVVGTGTFRLRGVSFEEALELLSQHSGYGYRIEGKTLLVAPRERLEGQKNLDVRYVRISHVDPSEVRQALALVMPASDVYVQPEGGLVVLYGSDDILNRAEGLIRALDTPKPKQPVVQSQDRSLLEIFQDLSAEMGLNLVADPALESKRIVLDVINKQPEELIRQIQQLVPLKVEITEHTLLVASLADLGTERLKVYRLNYAEPGATQSALTAMLPADNIRIDEERKSVIVRGTDLQIAEVDLFMADFDTPLPQVVLEVWVQEMSSDALKKLGVEWKGLPSFSGGTAPVFFELQWEPWELILALKLLQEENQAKLLANPSIATLSGQEARIFVGDRVPVTIDDSEGKRTIEFLEAGINLKVTPRISDDDYITILVQPEVSTFVWRTGTDYPQIRTREVETTVRVRDGQPIILGGLLQEQESENLSKIPFLSELPLLGSLFKWKNTQREQTEMTIFLIPRIVKGDQGVADHSFFTQTQ